ncbi:MAG: type II toxin-antitoxin system HipA family toxin [Erysipelotrichaceae bacterium]|nr:type II toxin-antitoxin system HipA family toxin [Erysipelotrichaceae bacterium]
MESVRKLEVLCNDRKVGTLAPYQRYLTAFEYSSDWLRDGYPLSPFSLPLEPGVKIADFEPFEGLFGIFADSMPDGWGRLLVDRMLRSRGEKPEELGVLERLSIVGESGMGALEYRPVYEKGSTAAGHDLDQLAEECRKVLNSEASDLDLLYALGASSGGARPKVLLEIEGEEWIVKFPAAEDPADIGLMEYEYDLCAKECGIEIPEVRLFPSKNGPGYFGCRRFDRTKEDGVKKKIHMATASGLLEVSHRMPALDYTTLMALTWQLCKREEELEKMYRLMCFNVFAHNRDDHSNNISYLCRDGVWRLSPAYDLTYSWSFAGEHATTVDGEGKAPTAEDILRVARKAGLRMSRAREIAEQIKETVNSRLAAYLEDRR